MAFETRFWFPSIRSGSGTALYYSYEVAAVHIIMLGSYADNGRDSAQFAWLQRDLASIDRGRTPWVIVGMHIPWYSSNEQHQGEVGVSAPKGTEEGNLGCKHDVLVHACWGLTAGCVCVLACNGQETPMSF